ncbi:MAG TPA: type II toxin-antitoxin system VapC family toxin [Rhodoblastus sp.]|nr:type II toxin-antitoxin system VapC family toxin [Rhodoblastus sp.]
MFVDASAIVALLAREPGSEPLKKAIDKAERLVVSPMAVFEAAVSLAAAKLRRKRKPTAAEVRNAHAVVLAFLDRNGIEQSPITPEIGAAAVEAAARYGKAVGDAADLNFGDCFSYACAATLDMPLLFKGNDFARTDIRSAVG